MTPTAKYHNHASSARRSARRRLITSAVEALEDRRLFAVFLDSSIADVSVRPGTTTTTTISLASRFRTTNLDGVTGTIVRMPVSFGSGTAKVEGSINLALFDTSVPLTVQNFVNYVTAGSYDNSIIHRSTTIAGSGLAVVQGGGFTYTNNTFDVVDANAAINNEFASSPRDSSGKVNTRGTIAMAKTSDPNSATSQWFINTADNSTSLDNTNNSGGFTTFGRVIGGLTIADQINALTIYNASSITSAFSELPLASYSSGSIKAANVVTFSDPSIVSNPTTYFDYKVTSSDPKVASVALDANGNVVVTYPTKAKLGTTTITLTASDLTGAPVTDTFTVTVAKPGLAVKIGTATLTATPTTPVDLGTAFTGQTATRTITLQNTGKGVLNLGDVTIPEGTTSTTTIPDTLAPGATLDILLNVNTANVISLSSTFSVASDATDTPLNIPVKFEVGSGVNLGGTGASAIKSVVFTDDDGTKATFTLKGAGLAHLDFSGTGLSSTTVKGITTVTGSNVALTNLAISSTTSATAITSTVSGGDLSISLPTLTSSSSLKQLSLKGLMITDSVDLPLAVGDFLIAGLESATAAIAAQASTTSAKSYSLGTASDSTITLSGVTKTVTLSSITNTTLTLAAGSFSALNLLSATSSTITANVPLSNVKFTGTLAQSTFSASAPITRFDVAALGNSTIKVGVVDGVTTPASASDFTSGSVLKALNITSKSAGALNASNIFAATLGKIALGSLSSTSTQSIIRGTTLDQLSGKNAANKAFSVKKITTATDIDSTLNTLGVPTTILDVTLA